MHGAIIQTALLTCGMAALLVLWDERHHLTALAWSAVWTAACRLAAPGWAARVMVAVSAVALLIAARALARAIAGLRASRRAGRMQELEALLAQAEREQWTMIAILPVRLRAYAQAARLLASQPAGGAPAPPAEPRPGPIERWAAVDDAYRLAAAAGLLASTGLGTRAAWRHACRRLATAADALAAALESELAAGETVSGAGGAGAGRWLREGAA